MTNKLTDFLVQFYDEIEPKKLYRNIFPEGSLQTKGNYEKFKYNGIIIEITNEKKKDGKKVIHRHTLTDDLDKIDEVCSRDNFCMLSTVDYAGKSRHTKNARNLYALVIEIDELKVKDDIPYGIMNLFKQFGNGILPTPTYVISSGNGLHLYFLLEQPIRLYKNVLIELEILKKELTRKMWHDSISSATPNGHRVQYEPVCQGFRVVGSITRKGTRTRAFEIGKPVTIEYLNSFVEEKCKAKSLVYKNKLNLPEAKEKYPDWHQTVIVEKKPKGAWCLNRAVYEWWKSQIAAQAECGHRYWCLWILAVYAKKCSFFDAKYNPNPVTLKELKKDSYSFLDEFDSKTNGEFGRFTVEDVESSLKGFDNSFLTFPIHSIISKSGIRIEKNKRNGRKQLIHLMGARAIQEINDKMNGTNWREGNGRKSKDKLVESWRLEHPNGTKAQCIRETKLSKATVYKWWDDSKQCV